MSEGRRRVWARWLILPPVIAGVAILAFMVGGREPPQMRPPQEVAQPVRVVTVAPARFTPRALGYGYVQPGDVWNGVAEVGGKIVELNPQLERGQLMFAGDVLLRIDPADYELAVARTDAELERLDAELAELDVRRANTETTLAIERRSLELSEADLERRRSLMRNANISQASVDEAEREVLSARQRVQDLDNQLNLLPAERAVLEANRRLTLTQREEARLDLERTTIRLPFHARIAEVNVEETQFVNVGEVLVVADGIAVAEVVAQVPLDRMRPLIPHDVDLTAIAPEDLDDLPQSWGLGATVRLRVGDFETSWPARVDRASETIDPETRTIGVIVAVDRPYTMIIPGERPPLTKNLYVEVELRGRGRDGVIVIPRAAVHVDDDGAPRVYVADGDDRLAFRRVTLGTGQGDVIVVAAGLDGGERVIVTDLIPAVQGMKLAPVEDPALAGGLAAAARGQSAVR